MGKIKTEEGVKLNIQQVCDMLGKEINAEQANVLMVRGDGASAISNPKVRFAHMVLDTYKHLPSATEQDMLIKKLCKHLMEKYMKSISADDGDKEAYTNLLSIIEEKAKEV